MGALFCLKLAISAAVLRAGFTHVSDDDYARVVIAELFAHAPSLDPSGTSWLPAPFWLMGAAMRVLGRSLAIARAVSVVLGALAVGLPYAGLRVAGVARATSVASVVVAMALPWSAWLGAAMVPEAWTGALVGAATLAMSADRARPYAAVALLVASLSRYEAWPACAVFAVLCIARASERRSRRELLLGALALAGPLAWMAWNARVHGSPLHFLARVSAFRRASGAAPVPLVDKALEYPHALVADTPEVALFAVVMLAGLVSPALRRRWLWASAAAVAVLFFLIIGDIGDGAPTHHPSRALSPLWWVVLGIGFDGIAAAMNVGPRFARGTAKAVVAVAAVAWCASLPPRWRDYPGRSENERRDPQIARGFDLRARAVRSATIAPCSFEHFALLAAWGEPERARITAPQHEPPTPACPRVVEP